VLVFDVGRDRFDRLQALVALDANTTRGFDTASS